MGRCRRLTSILPESIQDFLARADKSRLPAWPFSRRTHNVSDLMGAINEAELCGNKAEANRLRGILRNPAKVPMKLLRFKEDVRPAYYGTWTKESKAISGRKPLALDETLLSYDYDSEAEWEEDPEDAENLVSEEDADEESEDDLDGWLGACRNGEADTARLLTIVCLQPVTMSRSRWRKATKMLAWSSIPTIPSPLRLPRISERL